MCDDNKAAYGPCLASSYKFLDVFNLPTGDNPAYAGIAMSFSVFKKDAYGQVITTDSTSLLQTQSSISSTFQADASVSISGVSVTSLFHGQASFSIVINPTFQILDLSEPSAVLMNAPHIVVKGIDSQSETIFSMQSMVYRIVTSNGTTVCPIGYILVLDGATHNSESMGSCSRCAAGTYSVSPLAGSSPLQPSCLKCPPSGDCAGGSDVKFALGTWIVADGMFTLVGCPPAHQLINKIGAVFAHDVQNCFACGANSYILDSNNSNYTCQTCPTGAECDGQGLQGLVKGSVWAPNWVTGRYLLMSCPPGYELQHITVDYQQCALCPATYYCVGGSMPKTSCPSGSFAPTGSNASSLCVVVVFVHVSVSLPMTTSEFSPEQQLSFQKALAAAAGVQPDRVVVLSTVEDRRAIGTSLAVFSEVAAEDATAAANIVSKLNSANLNAQLVARGLPQGELSSVTFTSSTAPASGPALSIIVGTSLSAFVLLIAGVVAGYILVRKILEQSARKDFFAAVRGAKLGQEACAKHIPYELRQHYIPQRIIGRGAFGCVIQAKIKHSGDSVIIKVILAEKGKDRDLRQLKRAASVLQTFTALKCEHAVHLAGGVESVNIQTDVCWFVMELLEGHDLGAIVRDQAQEPISDSECIKIARSVLAALKVMHSEGLVHRDIKPANIMRYSPKTTGKMWDGKSYAYKLIDFGTTLGVDESVAHEAMMTIVSSRQMGAGTLPYMSPEMFIEPEKAGFPTDLWSLGATLFELVTGCLPFVADSELLWSIAIAGDMDEKAPSVLDKLGEDRRSTFDNNLAKVIAVALEKHVSDRYQYADEMHDDVYMCLIERGEAFYSVFVSYRVASEAPFAHLLFDELNHTVTPGGHRVTVYWDAHRLVKGEDWEEGFATGLLNSLCFFPLLSYGSTAPLAQLPDNNRAALIAEGWDEKPVDRQRLDGSDADPEDNVLKEFLIAGTLLERTVALDKDVSARGENEKGILQLAYPILIGRQQPKGHPEYPRMGSFFHVQGGGGTYPPRPSPRTNEAVVWFFRERASLPESTLGDVSTKTVAACLRGLMALQGCQMWSHPVDLEPLQLTKEQRQLVGSGYAGPAVALAGIALTDEQRKRCAAGFDEEQLRMLKAEIRHKMADFHEIIDRAVNTSTLASWRLPANEALPLRSFAENVAIRRASGHFDPEQTLQSKAYIASFARHSSSSQGLDIPPERLSGCSRRASAHSRGRDSSRDLVAAPGTDDTAGRRPSARRGSAFNASLLIRENLLHGTRNGGSGYGQSSVLLAQEQSLLHLQASGPAVLLPARKDAVPAAADVHVGDAEVPNHTAFRYVVSNGPEPVVTCDMSFAHEPAFGLGVVTSGPSDVESRLAVGAAAPLDERR